MKIVGILICDKNANAVNMSRKFIPDMSNHDFRGKDDKGYSHICLLRSSMRNAGTSLRMVLKTRDSKVPRLIPYGR